MFIIFAGLFVFAKSQINISPPIPQEAMFLLEWLNLAS